MADAKVILKAENQISAGLNAAKGDVLGFGDAAKKVGDTLKSAFTVLAIVEGLKQLGEATFDCFKEFGEGERRANQLKIALDNNKASIDKITNLIDEMRKVSLASKDDIESLVSELAALGKSDQEIDKITRASVYLSNVSGKDLTTAFNMLTSAQNGSIKSLRTYYPEVVALTKEQLAAGDATDGIITKFGELSNKLAENGVSQKLKNLSDSFSDLKENIGEQTTSFFSPIVAGIQTVIDAWNNAYTAQEEYKNNVATIKDVETKSEGERLTAALANAKRDQETWYQSWRLSMLNTPGLSKTVNGQATPIMTPQQSYDAGFFKDTLEKYFGSMAMASSFSLSLASFNKDNPPKPRTVPTPKTGDSDSDSDSDSVTKAKANYKTVEGLYNSISLFFKRDKLHPYTDAEADTFWNGIKEKLFDADALDLGPEAAALKEKIWGVVKDIPEFAHILALSNQKEPTSTSLSRPDQAWSDNYTGLANKSNNDKLIAQAESGGVNLEGVNKQYYDYLTKDALRRAEAIKLMGVKLDTSLKNAGVLNKLGISLPKKADSTNADKAWSDNYTALAAKYNYDKLIAQIESGEVILTGINKQYYDYLIKDAQRRVEEAEKITLLPKEQRGQSTIIPSQLGAGGSSIASQMADLKASQPSFLDNLKGDFKGVFVDIKSSFGSGFMDAVTGSGLNGADVTSSLSGMFGQLSSALGPLTQIIFSANPLMAALLPVIQGAVSILGPAITEVIQPLMGALTSIGETIGIALLPILDAISPIFAILGNILMTVLMPVIQLLTPFINIIALQFQMLTPLLNLVAKAFTILMSPVQFVADLFGWLGKWITALGTNIGVAIYNLTHWLRPKGYASGPGGFSSDAFTGLRAKLDDIDAMGQTNLAASATTTSANTASQSASYSGSNQITINIYQQAPIVGDGGMTALAKMIRNEFATLDYYNN